MTAQLDYPGRVRIVVNNDAAADQLGLIYALRSRHYSAAPTARLAYEAEALTPLDTAAVATVAGASGGGSNNVVQHSDLPVAWAPVLSTEIDGVGHMTHIGTYRVWARCYASSIEPPKLRFAWDVGDLTNPSENAPRPIPSPLHFHLLDLGQIHIAPAAAGDHRWQGVIQARGQAGGESIAIDKLYVLPVDESYGILGARPEAGPGLASFSARDRFDQSSGALTGKTIPVGGTWSGAGDADDFSINTTDKTARRTAVSDASSVLGRFAIASGPVLTNAAATIDFKRSAATPSLVQGLCLRHTSSSQSLLIYAYDADDGQFRVDIWRILGGAATLVDFNMATKVPSSANAWKTMTAMVLDSGQVLVWLGTPARTDLVLSAYDDELIAGGALESGKVGFYDAQGGADAVTRDYDNFAAWVPSTDAVLNANQSAELRTDGPIRANRDGAGYGPIAGTIGDLPRIPPSGLEERPVELFLKASRGDLDELPDTGIDDLSIQVIYRPSWLFPT